MRHFLQAVKEGGRHWPALLLAFGCSLAIAALWGLNIAALFPIIKTTLSGKSLQASNREWVEQTEQSIVARQVELATLRDKIELANGDERQELSTQADLLEGAISVDQKAVASAKWWLTNVTVWLPERAFQTVVVVVIAVLLATALRVTFVLANAVLVSWVAQSIVRDIRNRVFSKALDLDSRNFDAYGISGVQSFITHTADMLAYGITSVYSGAVTEPLRIIASLSGAMFISWRLTLASLLLAPLAGLIMVWLNRRVRGLASSILDRSLIFHHIALDVLGAQHAVQANTMEKFERERFHLATGEMRRMAILIRFYEALASPLTEFFGMGMLCIGLVTSSYLVMNQQTSIFGIPMTSAPLTVPAVTAFLGFLIGASDPIRKLSRVVAGINSGMAAANIIYPLLESESKIQDPETDALELGPLESIELRDACFTYDGKSTVLNFVNLSIAARERLAIVGTNGSGKSTLVNLICRFYDPYYGKVLINDQDIRNYALADVRSRFAMVSQKTELFNESVMHNIRYGRWDATEEEVIEAAKKARAHDFILETPDGYETIVGSNGHRLSGGQRQRVALARALLRGAEVLILDEATSQIDVDSERLIHEALAEHASDRTIIFVTHRESTLSLATRIVRMESGAAVEVDYQELNAA